MQFFSKSFKILYQADKILHELKIFFYFTVKKNEGLFNIKNILFYFE